MNGLGLIVEQKLYVIDESQQQTGEFIMQIGLVFFDELGAREGENNRLQRFLRLGPAFLILKWRDGMFLVLGLS